MSIPNVPDAVHTILGPIPVKLIADLVDSDGDPCLGLFHPEKRQILLCANMHALPTLVTLYHERCHAWLWDAGTGLSPDDEERVCDAIASAIVAELLAAQPVL